MRTQPLGSATAGRHAGPDDALAFLSADHQQVTELFDQFEAALESASADQRQLCEQICNELEIHSQLEEEIFYPTIEQEASIKPLVEQAIEEHAEVKIAIQQIRNLQVDDPQFGVSMLQLMEDVEQHVDEEENVMFAEVEKRLGGELIGIGIQLEKRKRELLSALQDAPNEFSSPAIGPDF